jgi:hypothetical protein
MGGSGGGDGGRCRTVATFDLYLEKLEVRAGGSPSGV